jgi:hypothetical protein
VLIIASLVPATGRIGLNESRKALPLPAARGEVKRATAFSGSFSVTKLDCFASLAMTVEFARC